jgi:hypothetical protein
MLSGFPLFFFICGFGLLGSGIAVEFYEHFTQRLFLCSGGEPNPGMRFFVRMCVEGVGSDSFPLSVPSQCIRASMYTLLQRFKGQCRAALYSSLQRS